MKAVFLAAGEGTRMRPLTLTTPKPLAEVMGKSILEHNFRELPDEITEIVLVVSYLKEKIQEKFGDTWHGKKITYVDQGARLGSAHSLFCCKHLLTERFLVLMGDDIHTKAELTALVMAGENAMLVKEVGPSAGGKIVTNAAGNLVSIEEGAHRGGAILMNAGVYALTPDIFNYEPVPIKGGQEFGLPQTIVHMAADHPVKLLHTKDWIQITTMDDLEKAEHILRARR